MTKMLMSLPGEGVSIEPIPVHDTVIRLEALKAAVANGHNHYPSSVIDSAKKFEIYIRDGSEEFYDDRTLDKVASVLRANGYLDDDIPDVISAFQNEGILFRERR